MRTEKRHIAGAEVGVRFPEFGVDHNRYAGQVVTVIVPGHEDRPLRYVVGRSRLPEGVATETPEGQDAALLIMMPCINLFSGKHLRHVSLDLPQKVPLY